MKTEDLRCDTARKEAFVLTMVYCHAPDEIMQGVDKLSPDVTLAIMKGDVMVPCFGSGVIGPYCVNCKLCKMSSLLYNSIDEIARDIGRE